MMCPYSECLMLTSYYPWYSHMFPIAMCKSSTLAFVLIFSFIFKLEKPRLALIGIILTMSIGVLLMVTSETDFVFAGYIFHSFFLMFCQ